MTCLLLDLGAWWSGGSTGFWAAAHTSVEMTTFQESQSLRASLELWLCMVLDLFQRGQGMLDGSPGSITNTGVSKLFKNCFAVHGIFHDGYVML